MSATVTQSGPDTDGITTVVIEYVPKRSHRLLDLMLPYVADKDPIANVHFRINSAYRSWARPTWSESARSQFFDAMTTVFQSLGFVMESKGGAGGTSPSGTRGLEEVNCHPDDISGWFRQSDLEHIAQAISACSEVHKLCVVDVYESFLAFTGEELHAACEANIECFSEPLLDYFATHRRTGYRLFGADAIRACIPLKRNSFVNGVPDEQRELFHIATHYVGQQVDNLVERRKLTQRFDPHGNAIYRTTQKRGN